MAADTAARRGAAAGHDGPGALLGAVPVPEEFLRVLPGAGGEAERWGTLIRDQMTSTATKTTDTIRYMVAANLAFMLDPVLREAVTPGPGAFSPADFVRDGGTLYLIAESRTDRPAPVAGVFAALVTEIYHQAALAAAHMPGGRLDPPMLWALDEVTADLPAATAVPAGRRRGPRRPDHAGSARRRPVADPVGPGRSTRHPGHLRHQGVPARPVRSRDR